MEPRTQPQKPQEPAAGCATAASPSRRTASGGPGRTRVADRSAAARAHAGNLFDQILIHPTAGRPPDRGTVSFRLLAPEAGASLRTETARDESNPSQGLPPALRRRSACDVRGRGRRLRDSVARCAATLHAAHCRARRPSSLGRLRSRAADVGAAACRRRMARVRRDLDRSRQPPHAPPRWRAPGFHSRPHRITGTQGVLAPGRGFPRTGDRAQRQRYRHGGPGGLDR